MGGTGCCCDSDVSVRLRDRDDERARGTSEFEEGAGEAERRVLAGVAVRARRASYNCAISASEYPACSSVWLHEGGNPLKLSSTWILCYIIQYVKLDLFE